MAEIFTYTPPTISENAVTLLSAATRSAEPARSPVLPDWSLTILEQAFSLYPYPDIYEREILAEKCRVSVQRVSSWFRNRRNKGRKRTPRFSQVALPSTATIHRKGRWIQNVPELAPRVVSQCPGRSSKPDQLASKPTSLVLPMPRLHSQSITRPQSRPTLTAHRKPGPAHPVAQSTGQRTSHPNHRRPLVILPIASDTSQLPVDLSFDYNQVIDLSFSSVERTVGAASQMSPLKQCSNSVPTPDRIFRPWE